MSVLHRAALAAFLAVPAILPAQSLQVTLVSNATIEVALSGAAVSDLDFGTMLAGSTNTVAPNLAAGCAGCTAGRWQISALTNGNASHTRYLDLTFITLPTTLTSISGATLPVSWTNGARACLELGAVEYFCFPNWTPVAGAQVGLHINGPGSPATPGPGQRNMNVYLGATANPATGQPAGVYSGAVSLSFAYGSS